MNIIDAHIHLDLYNENQLNEIFSEIAINRVKALIAVSMNLASSKKNADFSAKYDFVYPAFGFHPEQTLPPKAELNELLEWINLHHQEMIAIGEVGLPYYMRKEQAFSAEVMSKYIDILEKFIKLAKQLNKPIILHAVYEDADIVCDLLEKHQVRAAHFHWFKGDMKTIKRMIKNDYVISITPDVLYEQEIQELVSIYPLEKILVETDGPWPFEKQFQMKMTNPGMIHESIKKIAEIKNLAIQDVYTTLFENTNQFYGLNLKDSL